MNKRRIWEICLDNREQMAANAKKAMDEIQKQANEYGLPRDRYDSFRSQLLRKRDLFAEQYQNALEEVTVIRKIDPEKLSERAEFGSLIKTSLQWIFIATGIGKVTVDGETAFVISPGVPVYKAIEGKREGEEYEVNGKTFQILEIL